MDNFLTYKNNNIIPKGLIPKCYPAIHSENPLFWKSWKQNLDTLAITQLDLLIQETYDNITQLNSIFCKQQQQLHTAVGDYSTYRKLTTHLEKMASNLHINLNELRAKKLQNISAISQNENLTALSSCHHTANKACDSEQSQLGSTDNDLLDSSLETMTFVNHKPLIQLNTSSNIIGPTEIKNLQIKIKIKILTLPMQTQKIALLTSLQPQLNKVTSILLIKGTVEKIPRNTVE